MKLKEFNKLKPGDKVRIVSKKTGERWDAEGLKWLGKVMTVHANLGTVVIMEEDNTEYYSGRWWYPHMIDCVVSKDAVPDNVNHPAHYQGNGTEAIEVIRAFLSEKEYQGYLRGNVLKYILRGVKKGEVEDYKKAQVYLSWLIDSIERRIE